MYLTDAIGGKVNLGIAIVVPAKKILEVIQEELMSVRRRVAEDRKNKNLPKMDIAQEEVQETPLGQTIPIPTKRLFEADLAKAMRRKKP